MTSQQDPSAFLGSEIPDGMRGDLLTRIDTYYDTAPRATARVEEHGSLVLFVAERGWPFYARPNLARTTEPTVDCLLYTSPSPRDRTRSRMPSSA